MALSEGSCLNLISGEIESETLKLSSHSRRIFSTFILSALDFYDTKEFQDIFFYVRSERLNKTFRCYNLFSNHWKHILLTYIEIRTT